LFTAVEVSDSAGMSIDDEGEGDDDGLVPYAPDFTPATLGKELGEANVLSFLLDACATAPTQAALAQLVVDRCLQHVAPNKPLKERDRDRRDMASHVLQGLQNYMLITFDDDARARLTKEGAELQRLSIEQRDEAFARHILTRCNGYRLVEAIQRAELAGRKVKLEDLSEQLDRHATSKSISTMRAWLERAGVMRPAKYEVDDARLDAILGAGTKRLLGLTDQQVEFILAARVVQAANGTDLLDAVEVKNVAALRRPDVRMPGKMLGKLVDSLVDVQLLERAGYEKSRGGSRVATRMTPSGLALSDEQVRSFVAQSSAGMTLADMRPIAELLGDLGGTNAEHAGRLGEMLAVHLCLLVGLRVFSWRSRSPSAEIDLVAERTVALSYQRWHVQVKNTMVGLDTDHVDREVGAAAGTGATHLLFVVPRGMITPPARSEIYAKNRLTHLHIYSLDVGVFQAPFRADAVVRQLRSQEAHLTRVKRVEAERRESLD
jgi:hypothetical protein